MRVIRDQQASVTVHAEPAEARRQKQKLLEAQPLQLRIRACAADGSSSVGGRLGASAEREDEDASARLRHKETALMDGCARSARHASVGVRPHHSYSHLRPPDVETPDDAPSADVRASAQRPSNYLDRQNRPGRRLEAWNHTNSPGGAG